MIMKNRLFIALILGIFISTCFTLDSFAQEKVNIYDTEIDGLVQIKQAVKEAKSEGKHVFIQLGGNWCPWCVLFHKFCNEEAEVMEILEKSYVTIKLNYSPENKNEAATKLLENPGRFGYPVFVILDSDGKRIHTQNSAYLEEGKGYSKKEVLDFLKAWAPGSY